MRRQLLTFAALLELTLSGCSSFERTAMAPPAAPSSDRDFKLARGLSADDVRAAWGEPAEIRPFTVPGGTLPSEIWIYRRFVTDRERQVIIGTHEVPATNPRTGQATTIDEPDYAPEVTTVTEIVELLFVDRRLTEWKSRREAQTRILHR